MPGTYVCLDRYVFTSLDEVRRAGDSLLVMNSLLQKESLAGQVRMIYIDQTCRTWFLGKER